MVILLTQQLKVNNAILQHAIVYHSDVLDNDSNYKRFVMITMFPTRG